MGYTWTDGELITATKLNNTGGGGTSGLVTVTSGTMDKSYNELMAIVNAGTLPFYIDEDEKTVYMFAKDETVGNDYAVDFFSGIENSGILYVASDADDPLVLD